MSIPSAKRRKLSVGDEERNGERLDDRESREQELSGRTDSQRPRPQPVTSAAELATASGQFKSGLFKLQVDELLSQLRSDHATQLSSVEQHLRRLKSIIENIPEIPPKPIVDAETDLRRKTGVIIPFPEPRPNSDVKYTLQYAKPSNINVVGSFALKTGAKGLEDSTIDLAVTIPRLILQKKDYLDYRYFYKRAYYIACIAAGIKGSDKSTFDLHYAYQDDDRLRPVILVKFNEGKHGDNGHSKLSIRILTAVEDDVFPVSQTMPTSSTVHRTLTAHDNLDSSAVPEFAAIYNSVLRSESSVTAYLKLLHGAVTRCPAFRDACILGRTWLRQRGFGTSIVRGGFGHFEWAIVIALLLETGASNGKPLLSTNYNSYQLFKATMQFLSGKDLLTPFVLFSSEVKQSFPSSSHPTFFDGKRGVNLLYKMSTCSYQLLRHECTTTVKMLGDTEFDYFDRIFINRVDYPLCRFDQVVTFKPYSKQSSALATFSYGRSLYIVLEKALGDRAKLIHVICGDSHQWRINAGMNEDGNDSVTVGLLLNPDASYRIVDHGPSADDKKAAHDFRTFWGDKAELRRFKDGTIAESLVWSDRQADGSIIRQIIAYIIPRHFELEQDAISFTGLDSHDRSPTIRDLMQPATVFQPILDAFGSVETMLRNLDGLPLTFRQLYPGSPALRYASLQSPLGPRPEPIDIILQFEGSSRWPDNLEGIQMTKLSFLIRIGELLEEFEKDISCRAGLKDTTSKVQNTAFLDIDLSPGVTFRLRIYHEREQVLLERHLKDPELTSREKEEFASALIAHKRTFTQQLLHTQAIQMLSTRFSLLSPTIRAFKHWVRSHLLESHFCGELLELLVCWAFLYPYPWSTPASVSSGLLRTLYFLSTWDWQREPLVLDFNDELTPGDIADIKTRFTAWRKIDPLMNTISLFVASNIDHEGVTWTQQAKPPKVIALRMASLAKAAMDLVREKGPGLCITDLFRSPLRDYDFVLHLNPKRAAGSKSQTIYKNLQDPELLRRGASGPSAVTHFISELDRLFGNHIMFFHGIGERMVVAGLWKPHATKPRSFGLKLTYSTTPAIGHDDPEGDSVALNKDATLITIATLGGDLITKLEVNR